MPDVGKGEEKRGDNYRQRRPVPTSWWRHHSLCTQTFRPLCLCSRREPQTKKKNNGILRVWTPLPQRSATTASFSVGRPPPEIVSVHRDRGRIDPTSRNRFKALVFFFPARHHERKRPIITHSRGESMAPPVRERRKPGRVRSRRFFFRSRKKTYIFLLCLFFCRCRHFVAGPERVLCGAQKVQF